MKKAILAAFAAAMFSMTMLAPSRAEAGFWSNIFKALGFDSSKPGKFEIFKSPKNNEFYFHLKAGNGVIVLQSEGYKTIESARGGIDAIIRDSKGLNAQLVQNDPPKGKWHFVWRANNYQVVGTAQTYSSKDHAKHGAETVIKILQNKPAIVTLK